MKLKNLTIIGFKSFADKVSIDFDCEIVGIVGPNGCGKSNIVDAFRWVLGEQSAKSLRGDKMHDVLFAGTDKRRPLNMAEVSVTLTDIDEELPIAYDEVTITRRLYRNGESEYRINRQPVRLKDVQNLFLGSGIGKNTFSVFEQGKLDQVINLSPTDRRGIFDEAAGIGRFLQRKKETNRKLSRVSENYNRANDVYQEVEKQTKQLKKQAAQAKNFQENKERLELLERALLITRWRTLSKKHCDLEESLLNVGGEVQEEHHRLVAIEENLEETKKELKEREERAKQEQRRLHKAETEVYVQEAEIGQKKQRLADFEKKIEALKSDRERTKSKRQLLLEQIEAKKELLLVFSEKKTALENSLQKEKELYEESENRMGGLRKEQKAAREAHLASVHEERAFQGKLQEKRLNMQADRQRLETLIERVKERQKEQSRLKEEIVEKQKEVKALSKEIENLKFENETSERALKNIKNEVDEKREILQKSLKSITELRAREQALLRLKTECEGFSNSAKELLKNFKGKVQSLSEVLKPKEEMMAALHIYAQTLVVTTKKDLEELLAFAEKKGLTDFSLVLLGKRDFLKGVRLVADLKAALKANAEAVTEEGYYLDQKGVVFQFNSSHKEGNPFLREAELTSLSKSLAKGKKEGAKLQKAVEILLKEQKSCEEKGREFTEKWRKREMVHVQENFALQRYRADLDKNERELITFEKEQQLLKTSKKEKELLDAL